MPSKRGTDKSTLIKSLPPIKVNVPHPPVKPPKSK
jgi:hypothetical protein